MRTTKFIGFVAAAATIALLAGCSTSAAGGSPSTKEAASTIAKGTLTVGLSPDFPPMEYLDGDKLVGAEPEVIAEVANRMGLKISFVQQKYDQLMNSVRTGRVDVLVSGVSDNVDRQKTLDMVDYYDSTARFFTTPNQTGNFKQDTDVCGATVAVASNDDYYPAVLEHSKKVCESAGKPAIKVQGTDSGATARLQLEQGRAALAVQGAENIAFFKQKTPGKYEIVLGVLLKQPFSVALKKGNTPLAQEVQKAIQSMYDDGTLEKILTKYGIKDGLRKPVINEVTG
ncbi:ABC transporter substrate-binding protein [Arthrobacter sp. S2(2024)]|jgi:polar amino acid transport system substrate-binding protein|uniref:ABC transporter substrate-binding protein n=1 Tax=Arthrobacter sp. S2(2024) TaxID=3111911 RepID=UPI002FC9A9FC